MNKNDNSNDILLPNEIKKYRKSLNLTQVQAADLCGGGPNAFSRYEAGKTKPSRATCNLLKLLAKYPHEMKQLLPEEMEA